MFAHAALLGMAAATGLQAAISFYDDKNILSSMFHLTTPRVVETRADHERLVSWPWRTAIYVPPPANLTVSSSAADDEDIVLTGYFQSWRYFQATFFSLTETKFQQKLSEIKVTN